MTNAAPESDSLSNEIVVYGRDNIQGTLQFAGRHLTGGFGNNAQGNMNQTFPDDPLGSQGAMRVSDNKRCLFAVNAGAPGSISTFRISPQDATDIDLTNVVSSFGPFPASITQSGDLVYVLNAGGEGSITGYQFDDENCLLQPLQESQRSLGLDNTDPPFFVFSPAQIEFTPDGNFLIITNKGPEEGRGTLIIYKVLVDGTTMEEPISITDSNGFTPFGFDFDGNGNLLVVEAFGASANPFPDPSGDAGAVSSYAFDPVNGTLSVISGSVGTMQTTSCWIKYFGNYAITTNNGGSSVSIFYVGDDGSLSLVNSTAATQAEDVFEPIDFEISSDGEFVYVLSTNHFEDGQPDINIFRNLGTSLEPLGSVFEGIPSENSTIFGVVGMALI